MLLSLGGAGGRFCAGALKIPCFDCGDEDGDEDNVVVRPNLGALA
jgi:hypothetical protein